MNENRYLFDPSHLTQLPFVLLGDTRNLPETAGLYFVFDRTDYNSLLYIGQSTNLNQRWKTHERRKQVRGLLDGVIHFYGCDASALPLETVLIQHYDPPWNGTCVVPFVSYAEDRDIDLRRTLIAEYRQVSAKVAQELYILDPTHRYLADILVISHAAATNVPFLLELHSALFDQEEGVITKIRDCNRKTQDDLRDVEFHLDIIYRRNH